MTLRLFVTAIVVAFMQLAMMPAWAQQTERFRDVHLDYHRAMELMAHEKYEAARRLFGEYLAGSGQRVDEYHITALYHRAACSMQLFHKDAEFQMQEFIVEYPESRWYRPALLQLARYNFNRRDYKDALYYIKRLDLRDYDQDVQDELGFKKGFSAFQLEEWEQSKSALFPLLEREGDYRAPANYYYGHIAYSEGNYQTALKSLEVAGSDEKFAPVVPYYLTQIYHFQEKYPELIAYASPLLDSASIRRKDEIAHLVGNAHYQQQSYAEALPYLEMYMKSNYNPEPSASYQMAYTYYRTGDYAASISHFAAASKSEDDALAQVATYQMADAYLQMGEKKFAQNAFRAASGFDADREVTEDALFSYAKLAYELSFDPFHEAIQAFDRYLQAYPDSPRKDDAYAFLLKVHLATKNYPAAMEAIDRMQNKGPKERADYQKAAYNHAVRLMRKGDNEGAMEYFNTSLRQREDAKLTAMARYWQGDLWYRKGDYQRAIDRYKSFAEQPAIFGTEEYNYADYSIGYCYFKLNRRSESLQAFRKFAASPSVDERRKYDALLRIGDLHLVDKNYDLAIRSYRDALAINGSQGDYARFQIAMCHGYRDDHGQKIQELNTLFERYPSTTLAAVGKYQLGDSYFLSDRLQEALSTFNDVIENHPGSPYRKKSLLKRGLVQYRKKDFDGAIASYKQVVKDYGVDAESREAIAVLRSIYLDLGRIDEYSAWLATVPNYEVSPSEIDSLSYRAAENMVADGKCGQAIPALEDYLSKFPNGLFVAHAQYYLGDCARRANDFDKALKAFDAVLALSVSQFTEPSLQTSAAILKDRKDYKAALERYRQLAEVASSSAVALEAHLGAMRSAYRLDQSGLAGEMADKVIAQASASERHIEEARLIRAKAAYRIGDMPVARADLDWLAQNAKGVEGAEAKFLLAQMAYDAGDLDRSEKEIFELIRAYASYDHWKIRGFLLLADVYISRDDFFQARATLQSILDNVTDSQFLREAQAKMDQIAATEQSRKDEADARKRQENQGEEDPFEEFMDSSNEKQ